MESPGNFYREKLRCLRFPEPMASALLQRDDPYHNKSLAMSALADGLHLKITGIQP